MASNEEVSIEIMRALDVDYVLVIFGGLIGYSSDDINKFLWMIRIAGSTDPNIKESDYFTPNGAYDVGRDAPPAMINSLMYKLTYYRFGEVVLDRGMLRALSCVPGCCGDCGADECHRVQDVLLASIACAAPRSATRTLSSSISRKPTPRSTGWCASTRSSRPPTALRRRGV